MLILSQDWGKIVTENCALNYEGGVFISCVILALLIRMFTVSMIVFYIFSKQGSMQ